MCYVFSYVKYYLAIHVDMTPHVATYLPVHLHEEQLNISVVG